MLVSAIKVARRRQLVVGEEIGSILDTNRVKAKEVLYTAAMSDARIV